MLQLISDAGFQGEITSISTAAQQIEVFSRMVKTSICKILSSNEDNILKHMQDTAVSTNYLKYKANMTLSSLIARFHIFKLIFLFIENDLSC